MVRWLYARIRGLPAPLRRRALRALARAGVERRLAAGGEVVYQHENRRIGVDLADHVGRRMFIDGWYEYSYIAFIRRHLGDARGVFLDVGANVGNHSLALAPWFSYTLAFEPGPATFERLRANCARNPELAITPVASGLSARAGCRTFYADADGNSGGSSFEHGRPGAKTITLEVAPGDHFVDPAQRVAAIKIDVEGHELAVLEGLAGTLARDRPAVFLEWHTALMDQHGGFEALVAALPAGYSILFLPDRHAIRLQPVAPPYAAKYNLLFCLPPGRWGDDHARAARRPA